MLDLARVDLTIGGLRQHYLNRDFTPRELILALREKAGAATDNPIWIYLLNESELETYLAQLEKNDPKYQPLYGVPFAIKDNIDLARIPTTAACPAFSYTPGTSAAVVQHLIAAGAVPLGKTNMDQFATGLVGTRSPEPWGACKNAFDSSVISGGSSSGSAIALALGQVSFSLGTDTAGSGRVPASLNNLVGLKPSRGLLSTTGLVPACRSLDCISIFALNTDDANCVFSAACRFDCEDPYSRENPFSNSLRYYHEVEEAAIIGIPRAEDLEFFGNHEAEALFKHSCNKMRAAGLSLVEVDFSPFLEAARLLYEGPWVAERWLATRELLTTNPDAMLPVIRAIVENGDKASAPDLFAAQYRLTHLKQLADRILQQVDAIMTPTNGTFFTIEQVNADPISLNSQLGRYTNFMNLLDYSAIALPTAFYTAGVGFGVTLFHQAFRDRQLLSLGARVQNIFHLPLGAVNGEFKPQGQVSSKTPCHWIDVAVCGAHLSGMPLNWQLLERSAVLEKTTQTSAHYRFYALAGGPPLRPGLMRTEAGAAIDVEVWKVPAENFGSFVAEIPAPLGIGKLELADGTWITGFICDQWGLEGATDITDFGSWRSYMSSQ